MSWNRQRYIHGYLQGYVKILVQCTNAYFTIQRCDGFHEGIRLGEYLNWNMSCLHFSVKTYFSKDRTALFQILFPSWKHLFGNWTSGWKTWIADSSECSNFILSSMTTYWKTVWRLSSETAQNRIDALLSSHKTFVHTSQIHSPLIHPFYL